MVGHDSLVAFIDERTIRLPRGVYSWCRIKEFGIQDPSAADTALLSGVIAHRRYRDHLAGSFDGQPDHTCHGPYQLDAITVDEFQPVTQHYTTTLLQQWVGNSIDAEHHDVIREALRITETQIAPWYLAADAIYYLALSREGREHDWGWVVGTCGFYEFIAINRRQSRVVLIIATDD